MLKFKKAVIYGRLSRTLGGISLGLTGGVMVGLMTEYGNWTLIKTIVIGLFSIILLIGAYVEDKRFHKRNLVHHDPEKRMTTIVYGEDDNG